MSGLSAALIKLKPFLIKDSFKREMSHRHTWFVNYSLIQPQSKSMSHLIDLRFSKWGDITGVFALLKISSCGSNHTESGSDVRTVQRCGGYAAYNLLLLQKKKKFGADLKCISKAFLSCVGRVRNLK